MAGAYARGVKCGSGWKCPSRITATPVAMDGLMTELPMPLAANGDPQNITVLYLSTNTALASASQVS